MKYRPEIDGLRAVAVVPVVLFHAGVPFFEGGYLGVDVFFVVSGYLITTIILDDIAAHRFSLLTFYERRFRRILPAYVVVMLASMVFGWLWMMPDQLRNFGQSLFASSIFSSNILFWTEAGYFLAGSAEKPLLHTWSLSVEEQFYLFFPLMLAGLAHLRWRWTVLTIALITAASIALAEYGWRHFPWATFYLLPFRAWELGFGALAAIFLRLYGPRSNEVLAGLGLIVLAVSMAVFTEKTPMPSVFGLAPVLGTVLIVVFASQRTWAGAVLSLRPVVFIGLISYSTYLWHQPLLAFARLRSIPSPSEALLLGAVLASFGIGYMSWRFVEQPFRKGGALFAIPRAKILGGSFAALVGLAVIGLVGNFADGFPSRLSERAKHLAAFVNDKNPFENGDNCAFYGGHPTPEHPAPKCDDFVVDGHADVVFIGDSHSGAMSYDAQIALKKVGISSYAVTYSGCIGLRGFKHLDMPVGYDCEGYNDNMIAYARETGAKVLVITSRFPFYVSGEPFDNGEGGVEIGDGVRFERTGGDATAGDTNQQRMLAGITEELTRLTDEFSVVLLYPFPEAGWYVPQLAAKVAYFRNKEVFTVSTDYARYQARTKDVFEAFDRIDSPRLFRVHPEDFLCNTRLPGRCINADQDEAYYFDNNHLSRTGARLFVPDLVAAVRDALDHAGGLASDETAVTRAGECLDNVRGNATPTLNPSLAQRTRTRHCR
ncbi:acyltransferase family protein [Acuticoccus kandeliae]|uniref:acyltransferase family protein n=1 Tax=Acuticoccus kandeliae TaxID=2073160 RepID=UPI0013001B10|nr:acyltransferase family protein [Acuticoccus kandeliae]